MKLSILTHPKAYVSLQMKLVAATSRVVRDLVSAEAMARRFHAQGQSEWFIKEATVKGLLVYKRTDIQYVEYDNDTILFNDRLYAVAVDGDMDDLRSDLQEWVGTDMIRMAELAVRTHNFSTLDDVIPEDMHVRIHEMYEKEDLAEYISKVQIDMFG